MTSTSRFSAVSRRAFLQGVSAAALLGVAGCASSDADVLTPAATPTAAGSIGAASSTPSATDVASAAAGEAVISFTYTVDTTASSGGRGGPGGGMARNPYIAVWIEDAAGELVKTVSLWHLAGQEDRWLSELATWYAAAGGDTTVSSATRAAGSYDVVWDLTDTSGAAVKAANYTVCIESNREHGPTSLITMGLTLSGKKASVSGTPNNELTDAKVTVAP
ncbi:MAG: DUF2271 domain-containing protein [Propionicimonas sp.]